MKHSAAKWGLATFFVVICLRIAQAQNSTDPLRSGFENPPNGARPRVMQSVLLCGAGRLSNRRSPIPA
jgi:hypothetical protein